VPAAIAISYFAPWLVTPLLMVGGAFLCFEGFEKLAHKYLHSKEEVAAHKEELLNALVDSSKDMVALEKDKIKGAIRTDFILSAEIIAITLGTVQSQPLTTQIAVLTSIAILMTVGVYGLVAGIVKIDDLGLHLTEQHAVGNFKHSLGRGILWFAPYMMKGLSIVGTAAMFLVGGGILTHGFVAGVISLGTDAVTGMVTGALVLAVVTLIQRIRK
jgi:uncharacterized protein